MRLVGLNLLQFLLTNAISSASGKLIDRNLPAKLIEASVGIRPTCRAVTRLTFIRFALNELCA